MTCNDSENVSTDQLLHKSSRLEHWIKQLADWHWKSEGTLKLIDQSTKDGRSTRFNARLIKCSVPTVLIFSVQMFHG